MKKLAYSVRGHKPGVSLLIAVVMVGILSIFGLTVTNIVITSIRQSANVNRANEAYYAAQGALERGLLENAKHGSAYSSGEPTTVTYCPPGQTNCSIQATYTVSGQVPQSSAYGGTGTQYPGMYGIPAPGTGNAANGTAIAAHCSPLEAITSGDSFAFDGDGDGEAETWEETDPADHPCNWSRIKLGQTVSIPLYTNVGACPDNPDGVCNPVDLDLSQILVRLRTPCADDAHFCSGGDRLDLDTTTGEAGVNYDDTIVDWQITGTNMAGTKAYTMVPNREYGQLDPCFGRCQYNSEIYEKLINDGANNGNFEALNIVSGGARGNDLDHPAPPWGTTISFLKNTSFWTPGGSYRPNNPDDAIHKPTLKLTVVRNLREFGGDPIAHLEYQVLVNANTAPTDTVQTIRAEGFSGPFRHVLEVKQPQETGLLEYVIQQ